MPEGITCKVWNIKGSDNHKSTSSQIKDSIDYILNDEKTDVVLSFNSASFHDVAGQMSRECQYVANDIKTLKKALTGAVNVSSLDSAVKEMMEVKEFYGKFDGRSALHGIISLDELESNIERAPELMKLCEDFLREVFPEHQAIYAVHTNTENMHIHFIVNSVGLNGKKIHQPDNFISDVVHPVLNRLAEQYGFTRQDKWEHTDKEKQYSDYAKLKMAMRKDIDLAIEEADDFKEFVNKLKEANITVRVGKHISLRYEDMDKAIRTYQLGTNYSKDAIVERLQTKYDKMLIHEIGESNIFDKQLDKIITPSTMQMKKYSSMSKEEKKEVIQKLRLGKNPWREHQNGNWQLNNIANELNAEYRIQEYMKFYTDRGSVQECLENILETKKIVSERKKELVALKRKYKPILDIYEEMIQIERKAYLYEHENVQDYRVEFERYRELTARLKQGYHKNILDVAEFMEEYNERILYVSAQLEELSRQYREVQKYGLSRGEIIKAKHSLMDVVGFYDDKKDSNVGLHDTDLFYVVSENTDLILQVIKTPDFDAKGNVVETYEICVMDAEGNVIQETDGLYGQDAKHVLQDLSNNYGFSGDCKRYGSISSAKMHAREMNKTDKKTHDKLRANLAQSFAQRDSMTFTQAININSCQHREGVHFIANGTNPKYVAEIVTSAGHIEMNIIDNHTFQRVDNCEVPGFSERTTEGFLELNRFKDKYSFSDDMLAFHELEEANKYVMNSEARNESVKL